MKVLNFFKSYWPIFIILSVVLILFKQNYIPGTFLTGWDNLHPEFNFWLNIKRSIFAVWQEYQGLGLLGGMGHASDLFRQIFLWGLSVFLPINFIRYFWVFLMLSAGGIGAYSLAYFFLKHISPGETNLKIYALTAGLFYILNLATIQTFYVPFEAFIAHFAFLPWLLLTSLSYFLDRNKKNLIIVCVSLLIATPASYIPTLFVVYILSVFILISIYSLFNFKKKYIKDFLNFLLIIFLVNAFWLLPFLFFTITASGININSKINQMATETIFLQNKEFGNILDVMLLKGFWFNNVDPNFQGLFTYMMNPWRDHLAKPFIQLIGYTIFGVVLIGFVKSLFSKKPIILALSTLFLFSFTMLATNTPPFSWLNELFRIIPLFNQAFRFPFTKFSILTSLSYALLFSFGMYSLTMVLNKFVKSAMATYLLALVSIACFIVLTFPAFRLDFFYHKERLRIPDEYYRTFEFFSKQNPNTRIANFPQHTFWGWNFYRWGYGGSGFPWYGIKQPILDRAFDVWSPYDENYYWEITDALYSKDSKHFEDVLNKYQVTWLLLDKNVINPPAPKALFILELEDMIAQIPEIKKQEQFGNIIIYKVGLKDKPNNFIFNTGELLPINQYKWTSDDRAYASLGNYIASNDKSAYIYPFRSLFSSKDQNDQEYEANEKTQTIEFSKELPDLPTGSNVLIPAFLETENNLPTDIIAEKNKDGTFSIYAHIKLPEISIARKSNKFEEEKIWEYNYKYLISKVSQNIKFPFRINVNGVSEFVINSLEKNKYLGSTYIVLSQKNIVTIGDSSLEPEAIEIDTADIFSKFKNLSAAYSLKGIKKGDILKVKIVKVNDYYSSFETWPSEQMKKQIVNCSNFRRGNYKSALSDNNKVLELSSVNAAACVTFYTAPLDHSKSYITFIENQTVEGRPLHLWILNEDQKFAPIDTFLDNNKSLSSSHVVVPPQEQFGTAYSIHLENISIGNSENVNKFGKVGIYPIPYKFLTSLVIDTNSNTTSSENLSLISNVSHPNESLYVVNYNAQNAENKTLVLSQGFDKGWAAYQMNGKPGILRLALPFLFGKSLGNHVMVNNWENGWEMKNIDPGRNYMVIVYLPQYLEYLGFILLIILAAYLASITLKNRHKNLTGSVHSGRLNPSNISPLEAEKAAPNETLIAPHK